MIDVRLIEKSCSPLRMNPSTSLRRVLGLHRLGMLGVVREQPVLVARQLEEVVLLGDVLDRPAVDRAVAVDELVLGVVRLARDAVEAFVGAELDVARVVDRLQELLHRLVVARLGRADEVVVGDVERVPRVAEAPRGLVDELPAGVMPRASAARCTFRPCSSVPVRKKTSSPNRRRQRVSTSPATVV